MFYVITHDLYCIPNLSIREDLTHETIFNAHDFVAGLNLYIMNVGGLHEKS